MGALLFHTHKMWTDVKTDKWKRTVFVEKDGEKCVDFCLETGIITPAFGRTPDYEDRFQKVRKTSKKFLTNAKRHDKISKLSSESESHRNTAKKRD